MIFSSLITRTNRGEAESGCGVALLPTSLLMERSSKALLWLGFQSEQ